MDRHEVMESAPTAEQPSSPIVASSDLTSPLSDTYSILDRHDSEDASSAAPVPADMSDDDEDQICDSTAEVDDSGSDFDLAHTQTDEDTDDDIKTSGKNHSKTIETIPVEIEELHEEWHKWEDIYTGLQGKARTIQLNKWQRNEVHYCRKKLRQLFKKIPTSDPLKSTYSKVLNLTSTSQPETRKRKINAGGETQTKKPRLVQTRATKSSTDSGSQKDGRQAAKQYASQQITNQLHVFKEKGENAGLDPKRLKSEVKHLASAVSAIGEDFVTAKDGRWLVDGMKTSLYNYQLYGVGWAVRRERVRPTPENPKGGILADEMGCGKTITMLAVIVASPPPKRDKTKANLLLVQNSAAVRHWQTQIKKHCNTARLPSLWYRAGTGLNALSLKEDQLIIMTYSDIQRAWARLDAASRKQKSGENVDIDVELEQEKLLFDSTFYRLILDECQYVKNHNGATAKAVFQLQSRIQWLVSATPAPNSMDEYFPYFKILGLRGGDKLSHFRRYWLDSQTRPDGCDNIEAGLARFQLHRSHETEFGGVGILADVPDSSEQTQIVRLSDGERAVYDAVIGPVQKEQEELAMKIREQRLNLADGNAEAVEKDLLRKSKGTYAKILQLHKITAHPFLVETIILSKDFSGAQIAAILESMKQIHPPGLHEQADHVFAKIEARSLCRSPSVDPKSPNSVSPSHGEDEEASLGVHIDCALGKKALERKCHWCPNETIPTNAVLTECGHAFCRSHFDDMVYLARMKRPGAPESCSVCEQPVGIQREVDQTIYVEARAAFLAAEDSNNSRSKSTQRGEKRIRKRGDDFNGYQPRGMASVWLATSDQDHVRVPLTQSSKTRAVLEAIECWQKDAPDDKIIVFTQWVMMGKILGRSFEDKGIQFVYYFGEMSDAERSKNLQTFETDSEVKVIIMGFRCGGQGLDMYYANRVILVDPWWNDDGEAQGFARVKRKIQKKETFFLRIMAKDTIDMRIADIQESKREMTQRLRKEHDPLKKQEIELEFAHKACDLGLTSKIVKTEPIEGAEQSATKQQGSDIVDGQNNHENVKDVETDQIKSGSATKVRNERHGQKKNVGLQEKSPCDADGEYWNKQTLATSNTFHPDSTYSNSRSTNRPIKRENADDTMAI